MVSPIPMLPSPLVSAILAALVNVMDEDGGDAEANATLALPFIVVATPASTTVRCEVTDDRREVFFDFSAPFGETDTSEGRRQGRGDPGRVSARTGGGAAARGGEGIVVGRIRSGYRGHLSRRWRTGWLRRG